MAQNALSLRVVGHDLEADFPPGRLIQFDDINSAQVRNLKFGDIAAYWDGTKVNFGIFLYLKKDECHFLKSSHGSKQTLFTCPQKYFLSAVDKVKLPLWKRIYYYVLYRFR